ncbi:hypothetical protein [Rhizobium mongolense]|uniref:Transposase n=1 Tax=Rhizobium mongolense TaxID=57676 RepID=A0ABR6IL97_9HYPH|nr:hypothetical protein [Rhizobium mongolense]MBB4228393.1 hypothetical protein [Rhizobium mongolense]
MRRLFGCATEDIHVHELVAGRDEGSGRFPLSETVNRYSLRGFLDVELDETLIGPETSIRRIR